MRSGDEHLQSSINVAIHRLPIPAIRLVDPAAADDDVSVVEDDGLSGRDGDLRRVEDDLRAAVAEWRGRWPAPPDGDGESARSTRSGAVGRRRRSSSRRTPSASSARATTSGRRRPAAPPAAAPARTAASPVGDELQAEPLALADREAVDAVVAAERRGRARRRTPVARRVRALLRRRTRVVVVGDEADLLAVRLVGDRQAAAPRVLADRVLRPVADGEDRARELLLRQREQEIRLVLRRRRRRASAA